MSSHTPPPRVNHQIRAPKVRLIDAAGNNLGIVETRNARRLAHEHKLDLIEVSPNASPPVCRLGNRGKFLYELNKEAKRHVTHEHHAKEIQIRVNTAEHDLLTKIRHIRDFLEQQIPVRITLKLFGREKAHPQLAVQQFHRVIAQIQDLGKTQEIPRIVNHSGYVNIQPRRPEKVRFQDAAAQPAAAIPQAVAA